MGQFALSIGAQDTILRLEGNQSWPQPPFRRPEPAAGRIARPPRTIFDGATSCKLTHYWGNLCIGLHCPHTESDGWSAALGPQEAGRPEHSPALQERYRDMPVFIDICELVNNESRISFVTVPVIVRLKALDDCSLGARDMSESFPKIRRVPEVLLGCKEGELMMFGGIATIGENYFINEIVEGGPQILSTISYDEGDTVWDGMERLKPHDGATDISICIQHGITGVALSVPVSFGFKNLEMVFSPVNLVTD